MLVELFKCIIEKEPRFLYVNTEEWIVVAVTSKKDSDQADKESLESIKVINIEDMNIVQELSIQNAYFDDIYFKFSGNTVNKSIKVIRKINNTLYLRTISVIQSEDGKKLNVSFENESAIMPEFFLKNEVKFIENSIYSSLMITYSTSNILEQTSREKCALMDYNLKNEIKKLNRSSDEASKFHEKLIFDYCLSTLVVFSLSKLKTDPSLQINGYITGIKVSLPYIFITTKENVVHCYEILLDSKGSISPLLTVEDIEVIDEKLSASKKQHIIAALCFANDSKNLQVYLDWKIENLTSENFEHLPIAECIEAKSFTCLDLIFEHILKMDQDFPKMKIVYDEIEKHFEEIIQSGCTKVPQLLDKFFISSLEYGTPKSEFLPLYHTYDFRGSSLQGYFFGNPTDNDKDYMVKNSLIKVPDTIGTGNSLKLTKCLCDVEDMKIFGTDFIKTYIRSKWSDLRAVILCLTFLMWLNIFTVMLLVSKDKTTYQYPMFFVVNILLVSLEIIQAANLGIEQYIGIYSIKYLSVFQMLFSTIMLIIWMASDITHFQVSEVYLFIAFGIIQSSTYIKYFTVRSLIDKLIFFVILCIPMIICMIIFIFTSKEFYFFIIVGFLELIIYFGSYLAADITLGLRHGLQMTSVIFFTFYSQSNAYLLSFNMILLAAETVYLIRLINLSRWKKDHIIDYIICFLVNSSVLLTFLWPEYFSSYYGLVTISCYTIYRSLGIYMQSDTKQERMQIMALFCYRYTYYIFMAFYLTDKSGFLIAFFFLNIAEYICHRSDSFKTLLDDFVQLIFNWNIMDIIRYMVSIYWVYCDIRSWEVTDINGKVASGPSQVLTWVFVFLNLMKALLGFRAFDQTRFYVRLIFKCMFDIIPFLIIFVFFTFSYGLLNIVEKGEFSIENIWTSPFDQSVGGFQRQKGSWLEYFMFLLGTLIIVIIMLNLLISILGDTFSRFLVEAKQIDYKVMIETVYEVEVLLFWRKGTNSVKFFASCDNIVPTEEEIESAWQSKLELLDAKLEKNKSEFEEIIEGLKVNLNTKIEEIKEILTSK